ncbi:sigma-70 family RNA polymerase sigma factor [Bradyrhizobium sp. CB1650]|uniref:sigma-70 family RNA polymerase sigma factor n=1 Tax=Bradyrhizobium sp. CB1650 TaxID=3039153 RepID=UPI0024355D7A|nr:sigma-70 family RNA polymerase sigma factor [Bradyrhizobium sp. CB1650]WGD52348.1 sigma-70 family RNA polymerase sigma factor [Bradyrhizobium sp. CB1650]
MDEQEWLTEQFAAHRTQLRKAAYRILGSVGEADDALQESWLRISRANAHGVENMGGWLTTIVGRVCLDMLRARVRRSRREESLDALGSDAVASGGNVIDPEQEEMLADSVGLALLVVLQTLPPAERVAYVLHDMFDLPFDEIAPIVRRSVEATRQLASRARRRVQEGRAVPEANQARRRQIVEAFLTASRAGDFDALVAVLDPDVVLRADEAAARSEVAIEIRGASTIARRALAFSGRAPATRLLLVNGAVGAAWFQDEKPVIIFAFTVDDTKIVEIELIANPERLRSIDLANLDEQGST